MYTKVAARLFGILLSLSVGVAPAGAQSPPDAELGKRLYLSGRRADGAPAAARAEGDVALAGSHVACVACHRPSGFGSSEGGVFTPSITGPILFNERRLDRARFMQNRFGQTQSKRFYARLAQPRMRPAYTIETLARALREGVDPAGQKLDPAMPRYDLTDADVANLAAYLKTLSATPDPGVSAQEIHLATVVAADAPAPERAALTATLQAYVDWTNKSVAGDEARPGFSPYHRNEVAGAQRRWRLHVWELRGSVESWRAQLKNYYETQPVFALVSGLVPGSWRPIGEFCDEMRLPALFPVTDLPAAEKAAAGYSFYFSRGLEIEAKGVAAFLAQELPPTGAVLQISGPREAGAAPSAAFGRELSARAAAIKLTTLSWQGEGAYSLPDKHYDAIVIWPGSANEDSLVSLVAGAPKDSLILLPSDRIEMAKRRLLKDVAARVRLADRYELASAVHPHAFRVRAWMRSRGLEINEPRLQFQAYYAMSLLDAALGRLINDFYRDYLVEAVESEAEGDLNTGVYPSLVLGPGQRFASKGLYIVRLDDAAPDGIAPVSEWIIP